jgi:hypothetical integral membrane protein (TIGR02206 family)
MGFFSYDPVPASSPYFLQQFSLPHIVAIGILLALVACIITFRGRLAAWKSERALRISVMAFAILCELSLHVLIGVQRGWIQFITNTIPLDVCAIGFWLSVTVQLTGNSFAYDLLYFWGWGAAASFLFADTGGANWNTWHFYQYFISHAFTLLTMTWFAAVRGYRPTIRSFLRAVAVLFPLSLGIRLLDVSFQAEPWKFNYSFLFAPPSVGTPIAAFGTGWGYYWKFVGLVAVILVVGWLPWGIATAARRLGRDSQRGAEDRD